MPTGSLKDAPVPVPSMDEANPLPARVKTTGAAGGAAYGVGAGGGASLRMRWLAVSATVMMPEAFMARPSAALNRMARGWPSRNPEVPSPPTVVTMPLGLIRRMRRLP